MKQKDLFGRKFIELTGSIHNHSKYSYDSKVPVEKIVKAARKASLDYFTFNDHFNKDVENDEYLKTVNDLKVIIGTEIFDKEKNNHLLVFNSDKIYYRINAEEYLQKYKDENAICFVAHPIEKRNDKPYRKYLWDLGFHPAINGIEIWNFSSMWVDKIRPLFNGLLMIFFPWLAIYRPYQETLDLWDDFSKKKEKVIAFGSSDAHGSIVKKFFMKIPIMKHSQIMKVIRTNVFIEKDKSITNESILEAIKNGNSYIVNYKIGDPYDFYAGICKKSGKGIIPGEEMVFEEGMKLYFKLPKIAK